MGRLFSGGRLLGLLALLIILVALAGVSLRSRLAAMSWPEQLVHDADSAVSAWFYQPIFQVETFFSRVGNLQTMYAENAQLKTLVNEDASLRVQIAAEQQQNTVLKQMLGYKGRTPQFQLIAGQVTGRSPLAWNSQLTISVGSAAGVQRNLPVLNQSGALVGRVVAVARYSSTVELLTSTQTPNGVSAAIVAKGSPPAYGVIVGFHANQSLLSMQFISQLANGIKPGDLVVTSGLSDIYPRGIPIGTVQSLVADGTGITRSAVVVPTANLNQLDYVFVVVPRPGQVIKP
ncbi:MAG: rod shape-determining protein MreC [Bacilli bacterium]